MVGLIASVGGGDALVKTEGSNVGAYSQAGVGAVAASSIVPGRLSFLGSVQGVALSSLHAHDFFFV
jgi:hypothetical protein